MKEKHSVHHNQVRIIGGRWRSRKLSFLDTPGLRPTPDRLRETLFNWLSPVIDGARCLDLFAGSGALGFEALSRGADSVVMLDENPQVVATLRQHAKHLQANNAHIHQATCCSQMPTFNKPFDIVFLDPPYHANLLLPASEWLEAHSLLRAGSLIYVEAAHPEDFVCLPDSWGVHRTKKTKHIAYALYKKLD